MKPNKSLVISLILMVLISALYRVMPNRPWGFAPQIAIGLFSGALFVKDKKWAFVLPLVSLFLSDLLYQALYTYGLTPIQGFYQGQWVYYLLFTGITCFGFLIKMNKISNVAIASIAGPTAYFLLSNFHVWYFSELGFGLGRPKTFIGLMQTYYDALPFYLNSLIGTVVFAALLFGSFYLVKSWFAKREMA